MSPSRRRTCIDQVLSRMTVSERRVCRVLGQYRSTQRRRPRGRGDEHRPVADMIELARQYGRYGYRRVAALLRDAGWQVNDKRVERLWRREGLKVPARQPKIRRALAQRWIVRPASARVSQPRLVLVSVRKVIESYESDVIQGWPWQIEDEADVDSRKPRFL